MLTFGNSAQVYPMHARCALCGSVHDLLRIATHLDASQSANFNFLIERDGNCISGHVAISRRRYVICSDNYSNVLRKNAIYPTRVSTFFIHLAPFYNNTKEKVSIVENVRYFAHSLWDFGIRCSSLNLILLNI